jgi:uncharacterized membrane protein YfcA
MSIDVLSLMVLLITGFFAGTLGGLLGIGGCVIIMPVIRFGFDFPSTVMVGTSLAVVVFTSASGAWNNWRISNVDKTTTLTFATSGVIGIIIGSVVFASIARYETLFDLLIGLAFLWPALRMLNEGLFPKRTLVESVKTTVPGSKMAKMTIGSSVGLLTGITGLCGGYALVPLSVYALKSHMKIAIGTSLASFFWFALLGAAIKYYEGFVDVAAAITLGIAAAVGAAYGVKLMQKLNTRVLKLIFGVIITYVSIKYILLYFGIVI